jgi:N6-L-threonylcarbamoyladenine synthase
MIIAIETSCDDTSVALLSLEGEVLALKSAHQDSAHRPFGGVVPEVASRRHTEAVLPLMEEALTSAGLGWSAVTGIAVTSRPGLIGSLLVGVVTAKTLALARKLPFIGVNHIEGHLLAPLLRDGGYGPPSGFTFPYLALAVSGGHTHLFVVEKPGRYKLLGHTVDDAAGEAFDKFAKMLKLGFPGGILVDRSAVGGNPKAYAFPRGLLHEDSLNFSFSGLKTAGLRAIEGMTPDQLEQSKSDLCASYQEAIVEVLVEKLRRACHQTGLSKWTITGGVSANSRLRTRGLEVAQEEGATLALPPLRYCTDNAAMIALAGLYRLRAGETSSQDLSPMASAAAADWA